MHRSDTDSYNYSTIDESVASAESTLRYCLWKKGTQFTYDIPDGLIEGDCVEVKGRLTGKQVVLELSGAPTRIPSADGGGDKDEEHRVVPLRLRFSRSGRYKLHSDYVGREAARRGRFRYDFQADNQFGVQICIQHLYYDIRINDIELVKLEHGQMHNEIQMLSLDGEAEFSAVDFIDLEDLAEETSTGLAISMPMGEPMDNSSPASEPELIDPKKFAQKKASRPASHAANANSVNNVDGPPMQQQRTKRRTDEADSETPAGGVKARKTKLESSSSKEKDADQVLMQNSEPYQTSRDKESSSRDERRSRDRRPKIPDTGKFVGTELSMTASNKQPKHIDGDLKRAKQSPDQHIKIRSDQPELGIDNKDHDSKQERPKNTKTRKSSRTSSKASNSSNSEAAEPGTLEAAQQRQQRHAASSKERHKERRRLSNSPGNEQNQIDEKQQKRSKESSKAETHRQSRLPRPPQRQEQLQRDETIKQRQKLAQGEDTEELQQSRLERRSQQEPSSSELSRSNQKNREEQLQRDETTKRQKLAQEDDTEELQQSRLERRSQLKPSSSQPLQSKQKQRQKIAAENFDNNLQGHSTPPSSNMELPLQIQHLGVSQQKLLCPEEGASPSGAGFQPDEEVQKAETAKLTAMQPRRQQSAVTSKTVELQTPNQIQSRSSKVDRSHEQELRQSESSQDWTTSEPSKAREQRKPGASKSFDVEPHSSSADSQPQIRKSSSSKSQQQRIDPIKDHQQEHPVPSGSYTVETKPYKQALEPSKPQRQKPNVLKSDISQPSDQPPPGSYSVRTHPEAGKTASAKPHQQQKLVLPNSSVEPNQELERSGSYRMQQKSGFQQPSKQRLGASKAEPVTPAPGSYSSTRAQQLKPRVDVEHQQESEADPNQPLNQKVVKIPKQRLADESTQPGSKGSGRRRGSGGDKKTPAMDGVYRVVPVTPVVTASPIANQQQQQQQLLLKQKQLKQQSQQNQQHHRESAGEMSNSLWGSQKLNDEDLIGLSSSQLDSTNNSAAQDAPRSSKSSSSGLSSVVGANADAEGPTDAVDLTQQYMYYAADESSTSPNAGASFSSPIEVARDASAFFVEHPPHQHPTADIHRLDIQEERVKNRTKADTLDDVVSNNQTDNADVAFRKSGTPSDALYADSKVYDTITVESEPEPFVAHLPEPLRSGRRIIVCGQFNHGTRRATMSLRNRNQVVSSASDAKTRKAVEEEEFLVQLRQETEGGSTELICRQFNGRGWTSEQRSVTRVLQPNKTGSFCVEIHTSSAAFTVRFEDAVCIQPHTIPFSNFTHLVLDGNSEYQSIEFPDELELPYSEEFPQSLDLVSHILVKLQLLKSTSTSASQSPISFGLDHGAAMLCLLDPVKQTVSVGRTVPETGGFLCETKVDRVPELAKLNSVLLRMEPTSVLILLDGKPVLSYNLLTRKHYISSFFIDGNFLLKDVIWKEKRAPKWTSLPPTFQVGRSIRVSGLLPDDVRSVCCVSLTAETDSKAADSDAAFCLRCEPGHQPTVTSSSPSAAVVEMQRPPLLSGQRFEAHILCRLTGMEVTLGDLEAGACQVAHSVDPRQLRWVRLTGGAVFYEVDFPEQLGLPYLNRFPVSLKESRFVTVDVECGLHAARPNTISFALCTAPGDACLKPLVCEFNMAQGYASVAWSNPEGELCDEDTRKFDPRLAGEVETVALQATDSDYILSVNETAVLKYPVRHSLDDIQYVLIDGDVCITSVQFEGKAASPSCCIN